MKPRALSLLIILVLAACSFSPRLEQVTLPAPLQPRASNTPAAIIPSPAPTTTPQPSPEPTAAKAAPSPTALPAQPRERINSQNAGDLRPAAIYPLFRRGLLQSITWSPDSQNLVVNTSLGTQILSVPELTKRFSLPDVRSYYFLADGSLLAANGQELTRQDLSGGLARVLPVQIATGAAYALSPDGRTWVTLDSANSLQVQDLQSGQVKRVELESKTRIALQVDHLIFSASGERLFVRVTRVDGETEIICLDTATWQTLYDRYNTDSIPVFSPDGARMAYQSGERILVDIVADGSNWTSFARTMLQTLPAGQDSRLTAVAYSFMGGSDRLGVLYTSAIRDEEAQNIRFLPATLTIYNTTTATVERTISDLPAHTHQFAFSPDGSYFYTAAPDGILRLWDSASGKELQASQPFDTDPNPAISADGSLTAYAQDGHAVLQDPASGEVQATLGDYPAAINMAVQFSGEDTLAVSVETPWNRFTDTYDIPSGQFKQHYPDAYKCNFSRNGSLMICPGEVINIFDTPSGSLLLNLVPQNNPLEYTVSADGSRVASCTRGSEFIFVWEVQLGTIPKYSLGGQRGVCGQLAFSPDGRILASSTGNAWDVESGRVLVSFDPAGNGPAAISNSNTLLIVYPYIISLENGERIAEMQSVPGVQSISFHPDGTTLVLQTRRGLETWMITE